LVVRQVHVGSIATRTIPARVTNLLEVADAHLGPSSDHHQIGVSVEQLMHRWEALFDRPYTQPIRAPYRNMAESQSTTQ
jgi:hypothetical protein